ncbi:MAG: tyrosine-protein phosphatase, partial [Coriobacteriia bacterium]
YLEAALDQMHKDYGTIEGYFAEGLHIDADAQAGLRAVFVESA